MNEHFGSAYKQDGSAILLKSPLQLLL